MPDSKLPEGKSLYKMLETDQGQYPLFLFFLVLRHRQHNDDLALFRFCQKHSIFCACGTMIKEQERAYPGPNEDKEEDKRTLRNDKSAHFRIGYTS